MNLKRTPIYQSHQRLGAKLVAFAGWEMPVLYSGVIAEHNATRSAAGLFDVSHMGEIRVRGREALAALNYLTSNNLAKITDGQAQYGAVLNERGGVVDDIIVYRISAEEFLICANASNVDALHDWLKSKNSHSATFENESAAWGQIAVQGPKALEIVSNFFGSDLPETRLFRFAQIKWQNAGLIIARTGYSGEDGYEIFVPENLCCELWDELLESGQACGLLPCGLGARDSLRLEAGLPLHGHELSQDWTALQSGLERFISFDKGDFIGKDALLRQKSEGLESGLCGFFMTDPGIARQGDKIFRAEGTEQIGFVTSGTKTPTINRALGLALVKPEYSAIGDKFFVDIRGKNLRAEVVSIPFYKRSR